MANILLGATGSVAAIKTPELYQKLKDAGFEVKIVATRAALYFFDPAAIGNENKRDPNLVVLDEDEWPGREQGQLYQRTDTVLHIELRRWADALLIAPLDANTLAKLANGLADNCLTCVWRAWDRDRPVILAPAMNTLMWEHPLTARHLRQLAQDTGAKDLPEDVKLDKLIFAINEHCTALQIVPPQSKRLACDDVGVGAMADLNAIANAVHTQTENLQGCSTPTN